MPSRGHRTRRLPPLNLGESLQPAQEPTSAETEPDEVDESPAAPADTDTAANRAERRGLPLDHGQSKGHVGRHSGRPAVSRQAFRHRSR